jgi:hypothetical protein
MGLATAISSRDMDPTAVRYGPRATGDDLLITDQFRVGLFGIAFCSKSAGDIQMSLENVTHARACL